MKRFTALGAVSNVDVGLGRLLNRPKLDVSRALSLYFLHAAPATTTFYDPVTYCVEWLLQRTNENFANVLKGNKAEQPLLLFCQNFQAYCRVSA